MNKKSILYLLLLSLMIVSFFIFTGGITDTPDEIGFPELTDFKLNTASPAIYAKLPFSIYAMNTSTDKADKCKKEYITARDLVGWLEIREQGSNTLVSTTDFIFVSETGDKSNGFTGLFVDTITLNLTGNYKAIARFQDAAVAVMNNHDSRDSLTFFVGSGSAIPLTAGTYRLKTFTAQCASGGTYTYTNTATTNNLVINPDLVSASLNIKMQMGASALSQYPCLQDSSYNYNATGNYTIGLDSGGEYFRIEYENSAFVNFNFSYDGINLALNYSKNGSNFVMSFVKQ